MEPAERPGVAGRIMRARNPALFRALNGQKMHSRFGIEYPALFEGMSQRRSKMRPIVLPADFGAACFLYSN